MPKVIVAKAFARVLPSTVQLLDLYIDDNGADESLVNRV